MNHHSCLLALPTGLGAEILTQWLSVADRIRLDSAYCSKAARDEWLDLQSSQECALKAHMLQKQMISSDVIFQWAIARNVSVGKICMDPKSSSNNVYEKYIQKHGSGITEAMGHCALPSGILTFATCASLLKLNLHMCVLTSALRQVFVHCTKLREFRCELEGHGQNPPNTLKSTDLKDLSCPNIKLLYLIWLESPSSPVAAALIKLAVSLDVLIVSSGQCKGANIVMAIMSPTITTFSKTKRLMNLDSFCAFAARCTNIVHLSLRNGVLSAAMIGAMGTHLQHLKSLDVSESCNVNGGTLRALAFSCGDRLTELLVVECVYLSLAGMQEALPLFTKLTTFAFNFHTLQDGPLFDYTLLSRFTTLSIIYATDNDGSFLTQIPLHCPDLAHFSFRWWDRVPEEKKLDAIVTRCAQLRTLRVGYSGDVEKYMLRWKSLRPGLQVENVSFDLQIRLQALQEI